jgi:NO-binding membrane sensor protein with MHYT domain
MSTPQTIALGAPRFRIRPATLGTALGVLVAVAVSIVILGLAGAHRTTGMNPATGSQASNGAVSQVRYLGPQQLRAAGRVSADPTR